MGVLALGLGVEGVSTPGGAFYGRFGLGTRALRAFPPQEDNLPGVFRV